MRYVLLLTTLMIYSCGDVSTEPDWSNYDNSLKSRIDNSNCQQLQEEFNIADANSDSQRARTGKGNALLMSYIDGVMQSKECY